MHKKFLRSRARILEETRKFFWSRDFLETDTPSLVLCPGMEPHIRPVEVCNINGARSAFLHTSPEFAMKKILSNGFERIFQIGKCYRQEPKSSTHHPEFTMIEWYRTGVGYEKIMDDVEALFRHLCLSLYGKLEFESTVGLQKLTGAFPRFSIEECFRKFADLELTEFLPAEKKCETLANICVERGWLSKKSVSASTWDDLFFLVMMNAVEPALERLGVPAIVHTYPESQAALSNLFTDTRGIVWAKRFEVYAGGLELGNAFDELTDAAVQRKRFEKDMRLRAEIYNGAGAQFPMPIAPIDETFLAALNTLPACAGIAMGMDRIIMYFTGVSEISSVLWQESFWDDQTKT